LRYASREELIALTPVRKWYEEIVEELNRTLAQFEKLKEFRLIVEELSAITNTMTASMKIRRRAIEERFQNKIDEIYGEHHA
jgi:long-chain acyl-CoA synthetase